MLTDEEVKLACEGIDRLITSAIGAKFHAWEKVPLIPRLYDAARERTKDNVPLVYSAAKGLKENVKKGDTVIMLTGWYLPHFMSGETDGPPGVAALARTLDLSLNVTSVIMTEPKLRPIVEAACRGIGLRVFDVREARKVPRRVAVVDELHPYMSEEESRRRIKKWLDELNPSAVISVEKGSRNIKGIYHSMWGINIDPLTAKLDLLVEEARERGIYTIGVGDGGNEIGLGGIRDAIMKYMPTGARCHCPCGAGVAATTEADDIIISFVSNWGAYGIEAAYALMMGRTDLMHGGEEETRVLEEVAKAGAIASPYGYSLPVVDQIPGKYNVYILEMLQYIVHAYLVETEQRKWYQQTAEHQEEMMDWIRGEYAAWKEKS
ncbi:hypothetical protein ES703_108095 [subsurface metagenome]